MTTIFVSNDFWIYKFDSKQSSINKINIVKSLSFELEIGKHFELNRAQLAIVFRNMNFEIMIIS